MAAVNIFRRQTSAVQLFLSTNRLTAIGLKNNYSLYPSQYVVPVYKKERQAAMEGTEEMEKLTHMPVKAAEIDQTSSVFHNELMRRFTNYIMKDGRKELARSLIEKTIENVKRVQLERYHKAPAAEKASIELNAKVIMQHAVQNCKPLLELTPIKRGGVTYKVPVPVHDKHAQWVAMKWLLNAARAKERKSNLPEKLAWELLDAYNNQGRVIKQKQDLHKQCEANRAYAHYRWS